MTNIDKTMQYPERDPNSYTSSVTDNSVSYKKAKSVSKTIKDTARGYRIR